MDGLTYTIPYSNPVNPDEQISIFDHEEAKQAYCIIKDWRAKRIVTFKDLLRGE